SNMSTLMIETSADCNATYLLNFDAMTVTAVPCELIAYNLITPNNDGSNDVWIIETIALEANADNEVNLYNRWGALVWSADGYNNADKAWKGESTNGQALPDGTYYYEIIINGHTTAGYVELSR
ncbi:MAG: gliding motility-associated C-terminal domain-containing protein, partial [Flavobacteriales bacterium]